MVYCPACNGTTIVKDSRDTAENITRRRRVCGKCGNAFTTYEHIGMCGGRVREVVAKEVIAKVREAVGE